MSKISLTSQSGRAMVFSDSATTAKLLEHCQRCKQWIEVDETQWGTAPMWRYVCEACRVLLAIAEKTDAEWREEWER